MKRSAVWWIMVFLLKKLDNIESIGIDEMLIGKDHDYITQVYQINADNHRTFLAL